MNIPPILERLLLSNEAVFKNATLGLSGQNMVYVPPGKTAVLLEFSVEPFVNAAGFDFTNFFETGLYDGTYEDMFNIIKTRLCYQMQIINDAYATYFSFHDAFSIVNNVTGAGDTQASVNINFSGKREQLFIYTDRSMYFNFVYPYAEINDESFVPIAPTYDSPNAAFTPIIQNLPKDPVTFNNNSAEQYVLYQAILGLNEFYMPTKEQYYPTFAVPNLPQQEYLHFPNNSGIGGTFARNSIEQPQEQETPYKFGNLFQIPLVNVKYALINKRAADYGIVAPKNL